MSPNKENNSENNKDKAEESETAYEVKNVSRGITISSFGELEELDRAHTAKLRPKKRLEYLRKLNKNLYGFDLSRQEKKLRKGELCIKKES